MTYETLLREIKCKIDKRDPLRYPCLEVVLLAETELLEAAMLPDASLGPCSTPAFSLESFPIYPGGLISLSTPSERLYPFASFATRTSRSLSFFFRMVCRRPSPPEVTPGIGDRCSGGEGLGRGSVWCRSPHTGLSKSYTPSSSSSGCIHTLLKPW